MLAYQCCDIHPGTGESSNCTIWPCVRLYNSSVVNTRLSEILIETASLPADTISLASHDNNGSDVITPMKYSGLIDTQCATPADISRLATQNATVLGPEPQPPNRWRPIWIKDLYFASNSSRLLPKELLERGCVYIMDNQVLETVIADLIFMLGEYKSANLSATTNGGRTPIPNNTIPSNPWMDALRPNPTLSNYYEQIGSNLQQHVNNYGDTSFARVNETFANISESLTRFVRAQGATLNYSTPVFGVALNAGTCLSVRWGWLAFPAAVTACGLILFLAVAGAAARSGLPPWKASLLAWVFRGPGRERRHHFDPTIANMERVARRTYITLADADVADPHIAAAEKPVEGGAGTRGK